MTICELMLTSRFWDPPKIKYACSDALVAPFEPTSDMRIMLSYAIDSYWRNSFKSYRRAIIGCIFGLADNNQRNSTGEE